MASKRSHLSYGESRVLALKCTLSILTILIVPLSAGCDSDPTDLLSGLDDSLNVKLLDGISPSAAEGIPFETFQPSHARIKLLFNGDSAFGWYQDLNGYTVLLDHGFYTYATLDEDGNLAPTSWIVGEDDPAANGLVPGILPSQERIDEIRASSEDKPISYTEPTANQIRPDYIVLEGDMIVPVDWQEQIKNNASGACYTVLNPWPNGIVPYAFESYVSSAHRTAMRDAMDNWEAVADVHFVPRTSESAYILVVEEGGNWSYVGRIGGQQKLSIYNWTYEFIISHELAHALGVWHEQSRSDRDTYVQINWANITGGYEHNFDKHIGTYDRDGGSYDFDSVMHYGAYSFSSNGQPTIQCQPAYAGTPFGQRTHLSVGDTTNMATMYGSSVPSVKAAMTTPASSGATLTGSSYTFQWNAGSNVSEYWLWVGTSSGSNNLLTQTAGTNLSKSVTGLPTDGSTVYVRLFSLISGVWQYNDYNYVCHNAPSAKAAMTTPASSGATLTGSSFTFQWSAGTNVSEYWFWLGTASGKNDLLTQSAGTNQSKAVTGLPTDGSTVYVRLFSLINGVWQYNDYNYVCHNAPSAKAAMTTPASSGDTLTGSSFTFQWSAGTNVSEYWVWVGTSQGANDILTQTAGTNQSKTISGLPTDGSTVYVRLFSLINGVWLTNDYNYVCHSAPSAKAAMTTPASSGATLTGASYTFEWSTGTNVSEYWVWVGTSQGANDILTQTAGTNQSKTISGLPTDGSTVYIRLFSLINGVWQYNDYNYVSHSAPSAKAAMTTPAGSGATLTGASYTFEWSAGTNVSEYWIWVGSGSGTNDILTQTAGTNQSKTISGLPTDGSTVYVRLFSLINGVWQYNDYNYVCHNAPSAKGAMTTPASSGATLSGSTYTFQWSAGTNVTEYWMWVGTSSGTNNLLTQSAGLNLSKTVSNLPTDGSTIYVRLFSLINGVWLYNDYNYVTPVVAPAKASMTAPANDGDTINGSTFTFQWDSGSSVTEYWLWVGTTAGSNNLLTQSAGLNLSKTVSVLPANGTTVYVRLFSMINGVWQYTDYAYTSAP